MEAYLKLKVLEMEELETLVFVELDLKLHHRQE
jgi:hypothetical protein